jgi:hypothetical protein
MRMARAFALAVLLSACSFGLGTEVTGPMPNMMGCDQAQQFTFIGRSSLDALGLNEFGGGPESGRIGMIWVTADKVQMDVGPAPGGGLAEPTRMVCVEWADGSGMAGPIPDNWQPPVTAAEPASTSLPIAPLVLAVVLASLIGVSFLAFRRERPADG